MITRHHNSTRLTWCNVVHTTHNVDQRVCSVGAVFNIQVSKLTSNSIRVGKHSDHLIK